MKLVKYNDKKGTKINTVLGLLEALLKVSSPLFIFPATENKMLPWNIICLAGFRVLTILHSSFP